MILDEPMRMEIKRSFQASFKGEFFDVKFLEFQHPTPEMARETFRMVSYFNAMNKEAASFAIGVAGNEALQDVAKQNRVAGSPIVSLHKEFADDDSAAKEAKLKEIEESIETTMQILSMCDGVDLYKMTNDFGKMVIENNRCFAKLATDNDGEESIPMTLGLWEKYMDYKERLWATVRYCCFFGLTSSMID